VRFPLLAVLSAPFAESSARVIESLSLVAVGQNLISVIQLGSIDYATGLGLQQKLVDLRKEDRIGDVLLLLEHTPVITLGRNAKARNVLASPDQLANRGVEVFECDRGGDVTFHGPGQLVGYPIFDLRTLASQDGKRKTLGAVEFVRRLEEVLIHTCADFGVPTNRIADLTGVWTHPLSSAQQSQSGVNITRRSTANETQVGSGEVAKIAAIGVHISRGITSHGFALNVNTDLDYFKLIVPCGITSKPVTSLARERGHPLSLKEIADSISRNFGAVFRTPVVTTESLDAVLGHSVGVPLKPPAELRDLHKEEDIFWA
jgi:lipoyl(octanoyl) transferase